jgi:hypothetical protein
MLPTRWWIATNVNRTVVVFVPNPRDTADAARRGAESRGLTAEGWRAVELTDEQALAMGLA